MSSWRLENWSKHPLGSPLVVLEHGKASNRYRLKGVSPGSVEFQALEQDGAFTGVSGVVHWSIGDTEKVLSLMVSIPYNPQLWDSWVAVGITASHRVPDYNAMYSGTPDSSWFVRSKTGRKLEFADSELIVVIDSDGGTSKPVVRLSVVPREEAALAPVVDARMKGRQPVVDRREGRTVRDSDTCAGHVRISSTVLVFIMAFILVL